MEQLVDKAVALLKTNMADELAAIDTERNVGGVDVTTPAPGDAAYYIHDLAGNFRPEFPSCTVFGRRTTNVKDDYRDYQLEHHLEIEVYQANSSQEELARQVFRYAEAVKRILANPTNWAGVAHDPVFSGAFYSNVVPDEQGFLRACRVNISVKTLEAK